ncbi:valine--tRNA ligase [Candidatus Pacearchaeota archaeon]|nr:valine--tRNA ligase [Candidatus Pacearchaeota archaeon]
MEPKLSDIKSWNNEIEDKITNEWKNKNQFAFNPNTKKKIYSIDTPPPYVNTPIHMGHATTYTYMDFFARYKRMKGFEVLFPLGLDRNGLPIELAAEKKFNISPFKVSREEFIEACKKILESASEESIDSFARLGHSYSSYKKGNKLGEIYHTDSPEYRKTTQDTFIDLCLKGLVYEDERINNWDTRLQTTVADSEIEYKEIPSKFNHIEWKLENSKEKILIATTRPELLCTCAMVIYNPEDKRYKNLKGKKAIVPLFGHKVPIQEHPFAQMDKGTGLVMMCSAGDITDIQFFREMKLKPQIAITKEGRMNDVAKDYKGLKVKEAREKIIEDLQNKKLILKQESIVHRTPVSERSGAEIEFIQMPEYYLKQLEFLPKLKKELNKMKFYPENSKEILTKWIDSISIDWPISRRRFYATPIPIWRSGNLMAIPSKGKYYESTKESVPNDSTVIENGKVVGKISEFKDKKWTGEEKVFDTWFDSSISELNMINYPSEFAKKAYPISLRPQGKEIVRTWLYYTVLRGYLETGKVPFQDVWIHQHITDQQGRKMSKSVGNIIDPKEIIKQHGAESFRFWAALEGNLAEQDLKCSMDRIGAESKTINKLINLARFVTQFKKPAKAKTTSLDKLFIDYIDAETVNIDESYERYDFHKPAEILRRFLWEIFASYYVEIVKSRAYNETNSFSKEESDSAKYTLHYLLERMITLLYPIIPQVTSVIGNELGLHLHKKEFPKIKKKENPIKKIEEIMMFNSEVWKQKREQNISLKEPIKNVRIPTSLKEFEKDLISCHNLQ